MLNELPFITIAILTHNRKDEIKFTLEKLTNELDYPNDKYEIIVVDNGSTDETCKMIKSEFPQVRLIRLPINIGMSGWNEAFREGKGEYFVVLDDDSHILTGLKEAIDYLTKNEKVGILALNIEGGPFTIKNIEHLRNWIGFIGCGAIIRRECIEKCGGYADWIFLYAMEWEYAIRVLNAGFEIVYFEKCKVEHRASPILRSIKRLRSNTVKNELGIVYLYFRGYRMLRNLVRVFFWNFMCFRKEGIRSIYYTILGTLYFFKLIPCLRHKRMIIDKKVLDFFEENFWSLRPILRSVFQRLKKFLC